MNHMKVMIVFGTRPEAIKMAPVIKALEKDTAFQVVTVVTAQHREMLDQVLDIFTIKPDYDLNIMKEKQSLTSITGTILSLMEPLLKKEKPDILLVHGDTTTTFAASLSAFYHHIPIGHVEAGLRTWNKYSPFPEEMNRQMTDNLTDLYFAPTFTSKQNLIKEQHFKKNIFITGNTAIDALKHTIDPTYQHHSLPTISKNSRIILVTMHRRENQGEPMKRTFKAIKEVVDAHPNVEVVFPVHQNPLVKKAAHSLLGHHSKIHLISPLDVVAFHNLAYRSFFIMTDSGGIQEEAPSLGKPVLVLRDTTERPEGVKAGTLKLVGTHTKKIKENMLLLLNHSNVYNKMAKATNPYGDGKAADRIAEILKYSFHFTSTRPQDFCTF